MSETKDAAMAEGHRTIEAYGKRSWESAFQELNQCGHQSASCLHHHLQSRLSHDLQSSLSRRAIELIYLMCELESSVIFVEHAERVFSEASQDFGELKRRVADQLLFQSYIEVCEQY